MLRMTTSEARKNFAEVLDQVRNGERTILKKHDKPVADLGLLQAIKKRRDIAAARAATNEQGWICWDVLKAELGLDSRPADLPVGRDSDAKVTEPSLRKS